MPAPQIPAIRVTVALTRDDRQEYRFLAPFIIGRIDQCGIPIKSEFVSRNHVDVSFENGYWVLRDLDSANGLFYNSERVKMVVVQSPVMVRLGVQGPVLKFEVEQPAPVEYKAAWPVQPPKPEPIPTVTPAPPTPQRPPVPAAAATPPASEPLDPKRASEYAEKYFSKKADGPIGDHTMMIRQAFQTVQKKQKRKYTGVIVGLGVLVLAVAGYASYLHVHQARQKAMAESLFYTLKSLDVEIANVERLVVDTQNKQGLEQIKGYQNRRRDVEKNYDNFLNSLHVYDAKLTPQRRLIMRVARIFGECELDMPDGFVEEVENYIGKWKGSSRLKMGLQRARENGYTEVIAREMLSENVPPQFLYMALQESNFDPLVSGPPTRKGIAKGMWQFIPETGVKYGLKIGPLAEFRRPDPGDDRHHYDLATKAAGKYIKELYATEAQASGFLVMACYNWGEDYVLPLVRKLPPNPRERNFWKLLEKYRDKLPKETYDYVFYIVSAAVIGEDPKLFGFDFDNPLANLESR